MAQSPLDLLLAQQGQFPKFLGLYCCAAPLILAIALAGVYFGVRYFANRRSGK